MGAKVMKGKGFPHGSVPAYNLLNIPLGENRFPGHFAGAGSMKALPALSYYTFTQHECTGQNRTRMSQNVAFFSHWQS